MNELRQRWKKLDYSKHSDTEHHLEFGIIEALLLDKVDIRYIGTSGCDYLNLPEDEYTALIIIIAAEQARIIRQSFKFSKRRDNEGFRTYVARLADEFEAFSDENKLISDPFNPNEQNGYIAADRFVEIAMHNRTYDED